jgi:hypothetical protein
VKEMHVKSDLQKLQDRGARVQHELDRVTLRRENSLRALLKEARRVDWCNAKLKGLLRRREKVKEEVTAMLRAEKRQQRTAAAPPPPPAT